MSLNRRSFLKRLLVGTAVATFAAKQILRGPEPQQLPEIDSRAGAPPAAVLLCIKAHVSDQICYQVGDLVWAPPANEPSEFFVDITPPAINGVPVKHQGEMVGHVERFDWTTDYYQLEELGDFKRFLKAGLFV